MAPCHAPDNIEAISCGPFRCATHYHTLSPCCQADRANQYGRLNRYLIPCLRVTEPDYTPLGTLTRTGKYSSKHCSLHHWSRQRIAGTGRDTRKQPETGPFIAEFVAEFVDVSCR